MWEPGGRLAGTLCLGKDWAVVSTGAGRLPGKSGGSVRAGSAGVQGDRDGRMPSWRHPWPPAKGGMVGSAARSVSKQLSR